ncbi:transcription-associated protein 1 [Coemansia biformis]|uniref:Transcription-associated protein 1 n=1 Tax=Coemansia biformis TaxID=1286918 RepID=A0A9W8CYC0_9FUNG|nr:transcription-associated protein 1 [Coemansia biformis]
MAITNLEIYATRLRDDRLSPKLKQTIAHELCESLEFLQPQDYARFVAILWPVIRDLLLKTSPVFVNTAPEQKLRATLLDIVQRIPHSEVFRPIVLEVVTTLVELVKVENEDNAVVCLKTIYELHRMYRQLLESIAQPFLDLASELYRNSEQMLNAADTMDTPASLSTPNISLTSPSAMSPGPGCEASDSTAKNLGRAATSFKVLTEVPIIVVSIIQASRRHAEPFVANILPLILHMLELGPRATQAAEAAGHHLSGGHADLITAQSKTLSFLAFFARGFTTLLLPSQDRIARLTLHLLCACPAESTATRKEMLIATRHIVSTELRKAFVPLADRFLDMQVLVGPGLASQCILKPFAFSMLADLMHHIRAELSPSQLTRMVGFYAGCMHDHTLSPGVHTMCAKLLHNITECIMQIPDRRHGRVLLLSVLRTFVSSLAAIGDSAAVAINDIRSGHAHAEESVYGASERIRTNAFEQGDRIKELRFLLRSLVTGCKNVMYALRKCGSTLALGMHHSPLAASATDGEDSQDQDQSQAQSQAQSQGQSQGQGGGEGEANGTNEDGDAKAEVSPLPPISTAETEGSGEKSMPSIVASPEAELAGFELDLLAALFREGLRACRIHDVERERMGAAAGQPRDTQIRHVDREGKEQIEHFANLFVGLDPAVFHELFASQFDFAFRAMVEQCAAVASVQVFAAYDATSPAFLAIMLRYLCDRLDMLGSDDEALTSTILHMFKIAFLALAFFPEANEPVLQPYVRPIIGSALAAARSAQRPENYFLLLRALFRSIGGGRYESLYKEVFPVLQSLLELLNGALGAAGRPQPIQELFVEICLTVPVRLSVLLPHLSLLMRPLVVALASGPELVSQGLRTLELCIDNLTREFLDPILTPVMDDIMVALWLHLRQPSSASAHAPVAARILGKLGGRNRHMLLTRYPTDADAPTTATAAGPPPPGQGLTIPLAFEGLPGLVTMPLADAVHFATRVLEGHIAARHLARARVDAVSFVVACARYALRLCRAPAASRPLAALVADPLAQKRLAAMASPATQGCQLLEQAIAACPPVGERCTTSACLGDGRSAIATPAAVSALPMPSLGVQRASATPATHAGLVDVVWALGLASAHSDEARRLLAIVVAEGARQHAVVCAAAIRSDAAEDACPAPGAVALAAAVPEAIARMFAARTEGASATGCVALGHFCAALRDQLLDNTALVGQLPAVRQLVSDLCAACYDPDSGVKRSGCEGIAFVIQELDLGHAWLTDSLLELCKALLFTLKDAGARTIQGAPPAGARATLLDIIKRAFPESMFSGGDGGGGESEPAVDKDGDVDMEPAVEEAASDTAATAVAATGAVESPAFVVSGSGGVANGPSIDDDAAAKGGGAGAAGDADGDVAMGTTDGDVAIDTTDGAAASGTGNTNGRDGASHTPKSSASESSRTAAEQLATAEEPATAETNTSDGEAMDSADRSNAADDDASPDGARQEQDSESAAGAVAAPPVAVLKAQAAFQALTARLSPDSAWLLRSFLALITKELANSSTAVREAVKECLDILAAVTGCSITALLLPSRDRLLVPIFGKPLRALPHSMQIGNIDAITYCLALDPPLLDINEELLRLLSEALALADAEDQALVNHPAQVHSSTESLTHLRHVCIRMLTAAMARPEFADAKNTPTRARIISVFFKSLYHKSVEVVDAANDGLRQVLLHQQKLPRDLLQTGLRPILINLSDYKRLTVASLDGLARLLQLLTNYFKVEVGRKLLDHMQQWANPQLLQAAAERAIEDLHEIKILVAILQVFHLLPPSASILLDDLVSSVVNLEVHLCRRRSSPFRAPLFKFLNRYPAESVVYFVERIENAHYARIFAHAIGSADCAPLREALVAQTPLLVGLLKGFSTAAAGEPAGEAVHKRLYVAMSVAAAVRAGLEHTPLWLKEHEALRLALVDAWRAAGRVATQPSRPSHLAKPMLIEHVLHALLLATRAMDGPPPMLFSLLEIAGRSSAAVDISFVLRYVWDELVVRWPIAKRRELLAAFLPRLTDSAASDESNAILLQHLVNPIVATAFTLPSIAAGGDASTAGSLSREQRGAELLRAPILSQIHQQVWVAHMSSGSHPPPISSTAVRLELVQLSSTLLRHAVGSVADLRKDVIKLGWLFIRNDDIMIKNASYVLVAQFIAAFDTPAKIILQAYSTLLKAHQVESRFLVRQALDILLPALPARLGQVAGDSASASSAGLPAWAMLAKRVLVDNSASLAHTTHVYQLIAGHPELFFPFRTHFASNLVGVLQKMCLTHSATSETRTLALDIMELFLSWDAMAADGNTGGTGGGKVSGDGGGTTAGGTPGAGGAVDNDSDGRATSGVPPSQSEVLMTEVHRETIVGLLLRMLCLVFEFALKTNLGPRALELLRRYLDAERWPPMHLRLTFFERAMQQIETQGMNQQLVLHILSVLSAVTMQMQPDWFEEYFGVLAGIIRKCLAVDNGQVQRIAATMLGQLYKHAATNERLSDSPAAAELRAHVEALVNKNLQDGTGTLGTLLILHAIGEYMGEQFYTHIPPLMKCVQKYTKEHNAHAPAPTLNPHTGPAPALQSAGSATTMPTLADEGATSASAGAASGSAAASAAVAQTAAVSGSDIISLVTANGHVPLDVDVLVRGERPFDILLLLLLLLRKHISRLGDQRRSFLTYVIQLVERSSDPALLHVILAIAREWVLDPQDVFPTIKEKATLMSAMMSFVNGSASANDNASRTSVRASSTTAAVAELAAKSAPGDSSSAASQPEADSSDPFALLERKYLSLVLEVYNNPRFTRSEMTMRLEQAFLSGMQSEDSEMRGRFLETFDANMPQSLPVRLNYLLETQSWESVSSTFWLQQCLPLLLASAHQHAGLGPAAGDPSGGGGADAALDPSVDLDSAMDIDTGAKDTACALGGSAPAGARPPRARGIAVGDIVGPLTRMVLLDTSFAYQMWVALFPIWWQNLDSKERHDLNSGAIRLLAKPYHQAQASARANVVQAILDGFCACSPMPRLPPQLLRYLGQTYGAWHAALALLEHRVLAQPEVESAVFDRAMGVELGAFDALTELYTSLAANHYYYGAWKRHCQYRESHIALAYEQLGDWGNAQAAYERAQTKARAGNLPFSESEYCLWESRWVEATKRLQSWDMLLDLGLHEALPEIELEAGWRVWDWSERHGQVRQLVKAAPPEFTQSPRARLYETYLTLIRGGTERAKTADFQRMCKEGIRACLQKWNELPPVGTPAHIDILHLFQLMVELGDASNIYTSLASTKAENLESKSGDLKSVLQTWRERLPNNSDPINIWSDLVAWRQHIFKAINDVYVPFITQQQQQSAADDDSLKSPAAPKGADGKAGRKGTADAGGDEDGSRSGAGSSVPTSYAYRGYHEMAWIINRFAHVARLHGLVDVCISSLTRIYTLPNIEIQEAFLKLREQAKCYYHRPLELQSGLDVISNTNLVYFSRGQKAEFFTLKGQFLAKLGKLEEANHAFATGAQLELGSPKAWAAWGRYNDECFSRNMPDTTGAVNAISCYMQAAGLAKRPRVRRFLARTLWLLSQDDAAGNVRAAFDAYNGEMPTWYWIALVPQLLTGLDAPYSRQSQQILLRIAKQHPQALYYMLRTAREETLALRRQQQQQQQAATPADRTPPGASSVDPTTSGAAPPAAPAPTSAAAAPAAGAQPAIEELMSKLKTAHPLLTLSMEAMIDQIVHRLKPCPEEDIYRLVLVLLADGLQLLHQHVVQGAADQDLVDAIVANTRRVGLGLPLGPIKSRFEADFGRAHEMDLCEYVARLYQWQQMLRSAIGQRPRKLMLGLLSPFLVEFEQQKFEDVEIPGQYLRLSDSSDDFVRIERFLPDLLVELRSGGVARSLTIRGSDGSLARFSVQHLASHSAHQDERWAQLFRNLDAACEEDRGAWEQRQVALHLPTIVSLAPHIRIVQEKPDAFTLQEVYDRACANSGTPEIAPALYAVGRIRDLAAQLPSAADANEMLFEQICQHIVPASLLQDDVRVHTASPMELWLYRESFTYQLSVSIALTYMIACAQRTPAKLSISRATASICLHDLAPAQATPGLFHSKESVPFRLTPNIQAFVTELGLEGIVPFAIHKVAQRFTGPEHLLRDFLDLFVRDELVHTPSVQPLASANPQALAEMCERNVQIIEHRANQLVDTLPPKDVREKELSPMQPLMQLMMQAVAPSNLAKMDFVWMPWL